MEKTLVILAAGMGSRFGGLKQITPVGPSGEIIADYSVYDALRAGFTKVVFVIKEENLEYFKSHITKKYEGKIKVEFAFQSLEEHVPSDAHIPKTREKMLGTTHALLCAKDVVNEPFVMINADDFYGASSYVIASKFLDESTDTHEYLTVNYPFYLASSKNGSVNRGIVSESNGYVTDIFEAKVERIDGKIIATNHITGEEKEIKETQPVAMNFFAFKPSVFDLLEKDFLEFIYSEVTDKNECLIPTTIKKYMLKGDIKIKSMLATSKWLGMTYKEDLEELKENIIELVEKGEYPKDLWG